MQRFEVVESYLHRAAKDVVVQWLREAAQEADGGTDWFRIPPVACRPNRPGPHFGIWPEWPISTGDAGCEIVWDEWDDWCDPLPPVDAFIARGIKPACVVDIGIQHKGRLGCAVEIIHKNPVPQWKRDLLEQRGVPLVEVSALGVLRQVKRPDRLPLYTPGRP